MLTIQHEEMINKLGELRRACQIQDSQSASEYASQLGRLLWAHNKLEEDGLFTALMSKSEFADSLVKLRIEHKQINELVARIHAGETSAIEILEKTLRNNFSNEENGLFPASAVTLDGAIWDAIELAQGL